jgi:putative transposase
MANTYTQIYIHTVFAVQARQPLIPKERRNELDKYMTGIIKNRDQKVIAIKSVKDHTHIFIGLKPTIAVSDLIRDVKAGSSAFINAQHWIPGRFSWQEGFGAFSHSRSEIDRVAKYIQQQEEHHRQKTFREEYLEVLRDFAVEYENRFLFEWVEETEST